MNLEKDSGNIKWFRDNELKIKVKKCEKKSEVWVAFKKYNICFELIMFDFIERIKDELILNVAVKKILNNQMIFVVDSEDALELVNYIIRFINEWNIQIDKDTNSNANIIPDELWYKIG